MTNLQLDRNNWLKSVRYPLSGGNTEKDSGYENKHDFQYVTKAEAAPIKNELIELIGLVQDDVRKYFTFRYDFIGSSRRNMITYDTKSNTGFDFDVNFEPNYPCEPEDKYSAAEVHKILFESLSKCAEQFGYSKIEASTSVITIKVIDRVNSRIKYSCDIAIVYNYYDEDKKKKIQQYIRYNKSHHNFTWEFRGEDHYQLHDKTEWLKNHKLWNEVRDCYLQNKNNNNDSNKHSRSIFAESINDVCNEYEYQG